MGVELKSINIDEDEIFKSLNHSIRRNIIRIIGNDSIRFSDIKKKIETQENIDSPILSYHLKSLFPLIEQDEKEKRYKLTDLGFAAYKLLLKTDQSKTLTRYKRRFIYAYVITHVCWIAIQFIIPYALMLTPEGIPDNYYVIGIILAVTTPINMTIVGYLKEMKFNTS